LAKCIQPDKLSDPARQLFVKKRLLLWNFFPFFRGGFGKTSGDGLPSYGVANVETSGRVLERPEAAIMNQLYHEASPLCDVLDRGMMLAPRRETEEPITVWNDCGSKLHGLSTSFAI
jgi:hypothetical protein